MDHIERQYLKTIGENLGRIADVLEAVQADARAAKEVDVNKVLSDATAALRKANPAFDLAFSAMERQLGKQIPSEVDS